MRRRFDPPEPGGGGMPEWLEGARESLERAAEWAEELARERPLEALAMAFLAGFAAGALLRRER